MPFITKKNDFFSRFSLFFSFFFLHWNYWMCFAMLCNTHIQVLIDTCNSGSCLCPVKAQTDKILRFFRRFQCHRLFKERGLIIFKIFKFRRKKSRKCTTEIPVLEGGGGEEKQTWKFRFLFARELLGQNLRRSRNVYNWKIVFKSSFFKRHRRMLIKFEGDFGAIPSCLQFTGGNNFEFAIFLRLGKWRTRFWFTWVAVSRIKFPLF